MRSRVGNYLIRHQIGRGGTATVYVGTEIGTGRRVAIKRLHEFLAQDPQFATMLADEARLGARIAHPKAVPVSDLVVEAETTSAIMDYIHGESLANLRKLVGGPFPVDIALTIVSDVLEGLEAAHGATDESGSPLNLVHRDVAPDNIIVGDDGVSRITDFGIAKAIGRSQVTATGVVKGKFRYMAPEQAGGETSRASDIFSAGVVLWELLTGERLFDAEHEATILVQLLSAPIRPPSELQPTISAELDAIVLRALARKPKDRFATAQLMWSALQPLPRRSPRGVAVWLEAVAGSSMRKRLRDIESDESAVHDASSAPTMLAASISRPPLSQPVPPSHPSAAGLTTGGGGSPFEAGTPLTGTVRFALAAPRTTRVWTWVAVASMMTLGAATAWTLRARLKNESRRDSPAVAAATSGTPTTPPPASTDAVQTAETAQAATLQGTVRSAMSASASATTQIGAVPHSCVPPYTIDSHGFRVYRRECLK